MTRNWVEPPMRPELREILEWVASIDKHQTLPEWSFFERKKELAAKLLKEQE